MASPLDIPGIRNITVSGRIGSGATTLAAHLSEKLSWEMLDGGKLMRKIQAEIGASIEETLKRPDNFDLEYEEKIKNMLKENSHKIVQSHLAGFDARGIPDVFKILVVCEDEKGNDKLEIRIDRLVNRDGISIEQAKQEIIERDRQNLSKWRKLYVGDDPNWVYWDKKYYDLVINTYDKNQGQTFQAALSALGIS